MMAANVRQDCLTALATGLALIDQFQSSLSTSVVADQQAVANVDHPSPLLLSRAAAETLKQTATKLSLLSITPPFTDTAITALVQPLNGSILPSLVTAVLLVTSANFPESFADEAKRLGRATLSDVRSLIELVERRAKDETPKAEASKSVKKAITEATGRIWENCDSVVKLSTDGVPGFVVRRVESWLALMKDAVKELQDWDPEEDVDEDIFGDAASDDEGPSNTYTDKENDQDQATIAAGVKDQALKVLSRIPQSIHVVVKQRLARMPADFASGVKPLSAEHKKTLDQVVRETRHISECIDESAESIYMGNPELCLKKAGEARALTINVVASVLSSWESPSSNAEPSKEDLFIKRALAWIEQADATAAAKVNSS